MSTPPPQLSQPLSHVQPPAISHCRRDSQANDQPRRPQKHTKIDSVHLCQSWQYNFTELVGSASKKLGQAIILLNKRIPRNENQSRHHCTFTLPSPQTIATKKSPTPSPRLQTTTTRAASQLTGHGPADWTVLLQTSLAQPQRCLLEEPQGTRMKHTSPLQPRTRTKYSHPQKTPSRVQPPRWQHGTQKKTPRAVNPARNNPPTKITSWKAAATDLQGPRLSTTSRRGNKEQQAIRPAHTPPLTTPAYSHPTAVHHTRGRHTGTTRGTAAELPSDPQTHSNSKIP